VWGEPKEENFQNDRRGRVDGTEDNENREREEEGKGARERRSEKKEFHRTTPSGNLVVVVKHRVVTLVI